MSICSHTVAAPASWGPHRWRSFRSSVSTRSSPSPKRLRTRRVQLGTGAAASGRRLRRGTPAHPLARRPDHHRRTPDSPQSACWSGSSCNPATAAESRACDRLTTMGLSTPSVAAIGPRATRNPCGRVAPPRPVRIAVRHRLQFGLAALTVSALTTAWALGVGGRWRQSLVLAAGAVALAAGVLQRRRGRGDRNRPGDPRLLAAPEAGLDRGRCV